MEIEKLIENCKYFNPKIKKAVKDRLIHCRLCDRYIEKDEVYVYWDERSKEMIQKLGFENQNKLRFILCKECFEMYKEDLIKLYNEGWIQLNEEEIEEMEDAE